MVEKMYKVDDVAKLFDVTPYTVRHWINTDMLHAVKIRSGHWRVPESAVEEFANQKYGELNEA